MLELPPGVFVMYPSSLFFHFNVDVCGEALNLPLYLHLTLTHFGLDVDLVVTPDGAQPTKENSIPLDGTAGRGSCVWFNQASLFQTSELGVETIALAKKQGKDAACDARGLIERGLFPKAI